MNYLNESVWEHEALEHLAELGWKPTTGAAIAPGAGVTDTDEERRSWADLVLHRRFIQKLVSLNPGVPVNLLHDAAKQITTAVSNDALSEHARFHEYLSEGFRGFTYTTQDGEEVNPTIQLISPDPEKNEYLAASQVTLKDLNHERRFDLLLYVNGLPIAIFELKRAGDESATLSKAHAQITTYIKEFPGAFLPIELAVISDGITAKYGTPYTPLNHFTPWNVDPLSGQLLENEDYFDHEDNYVTALRNLIDGLFNPERFYEFLRGFIAFDATANGHVKRVAKPHQYFAVTKALDKTRQAVKGDGKAGVVWHTQGSGKSMEMELYANLVGRDPALANPTIVVVTDRTELDGQLFETFNQSLILGERPQKILQRSALRQHLSDRVTGGIYFTTLQKFGLTQSERDNGTPHPTLSTRQNIIVIVDEAHRSHYDSLNGFARHLKDALPNATMIAFTGTPISQVDKNTRAVFGDYIDIYDLSRAVADGATVPVYYESRLIKVELADGIDLEAIDEQADQITDGMDAEERSHIQKKVLQLTAIYGAPARLKTLAADFVTHWEARREAMFEALGTPERPSTPGKAMIVCATREICARLYEQIIELRPEWHSDSDAAGKIKVLYTGDATDTGEVARHVRKDSAVAAIKNRVKDVDDELEIVIVQSMMLTGFDAPPLHTLYLDRPIKGALLMQTLARVNRTYRGKQEGLLVGYAPVTDNLAQALTEYTGESATAQSTGVPIEEAIAGVKKVLTGLRALVEPSGVLNNLSSGTPSGLQTALYKAVNYVRSPLSPGNKNVDPKDSLLTTFKNESTKASRLWKLVGSHSGVHSLLLEAKFYEEMRVWIAKFEAQERLATGAPLPEDVQRALNQITNASVASGEVLDIYDAAGLPKVSLQSLNQEVLSQAQNSANPHLAIEALKALIQRESKAATRNNLTKMKEFSERLGDLMVQYTNAQLSSAEILAVMFDLAVEIRDESNRGTRFDPPLNPDELAFYDAVASNKSALEIMGDDKLAHIARQLLGVLKADRRTDWTKSEQVRARLRTSIKRILRVTGYPPDKQVDAIKLVIEQMEALAPSYM